MSDAAAVVVVEGESDRVALDTFAHRLGHDLGGERVSIAPVGGAAAARSFLAHLLASGFDGRLAGLCDEAEADEFRQALEQAWLGRGAAAEPGVFVCDVDLEDELIRAAGIATVERIIASAGEARPWRTFRQQPEWRNRSTVAQLRRFMGAKSGRKARYAGLLASEIELTRIPAPLHGVLDHVLK